MTRSLPQRVLVVRLGAIGDVTNALVFASALRDAAPGTHIAWVVHPLAEPLVRDHPCVDRVHVWQRGGGPSELWRLVRELRRERYDLAVDLQRLQKSALLARLSGAPRVLGYDRGRTKELSWLWTKERIAPPADRGEAGQRATHATHMVDQYLEFAAHLGLPVDRPRHVLPRDPQAEAWAEARLAEFGAAPVLLNLGATKPANRWPAERFGELARALATEHGAAVCFTGSAADAEAERAALRAAGEAPGVHSTVGRSDLRQLIALTRRARLFIGCDTGPMHLAVALGRPVLALFGPADPERTGPYGRPAEVLRVPPPCAPCNRSRCDQPRHHCMLDIEVQEVLRAAAERLAAAEQPDDQSSTSSVM